MRQPGADPVYRRMAGEQTSPTVGLCFRQLVFRCGMRPESLEIG